jgi:hypothetical protein
VDRCRACPPADRGVDEAAGESYRYVVLQDNGEPDGLRVIDLGAGHASQGETLCGRVITALKSQGLLNEGVGSGYIDRNWPPALKESGAWPLTSLRQSFLNGALTRLPDPDTILRKKIGEFVEKGDFGPASGQAGGTYQRVWFQEWLSPDEISFEPNVFLLTKARAHALKTKPAEPKETTLFSTPGPQDGAGTGSSPKGTPEPETEVPEDEEEVAAPEARTVRVVGMIPPELWNRLGTKILPKLKSGEDVTARVEFSVRVKSDAAKGLEAELRQILDDLGLSQDVQIL